MNTSDDTVLSAAVGIGTLDSRGRVIEVYYPLPRRGLSPGVVGAFKQVCDTDSGCADRLSASAAEKIAAAFEADGITAEAVRRLAGGFNGGGISPINNGGSANGVGNRCLVACLSADDEVPQSVTAAYLKLHLLSHRLVRPHQVNLDGIFGILPNNAWTDAGAVAVEDLARRQLEARIQGRGLHVRSVDKFPPMADYVVPAGVRIADTARVRLGAYLGEGTTVMHAGFINFNAGAEGPAMVEGRVSAGVMVGAGSDLGGGSSTMGTLSGGGSEIISVGRDCLIGANAGIGIPLADGCIVEAGLYVTAGTKVTVLDGAGRALETVKALDLSTRPGLLFRRNSLSGAVECLPRSAAIALNPDLHGHN